MKRHRAALAQFYADEYVFTDADGVVSTKAKELGKVRLEGKEYEFVDGDVTEFRFNV